MVSSASSTKLQNCAAVCITLWRFFISVCSFYVNPASSIYHLSLSLSLAHTSFKESFGSIDVVRRDIEETKQKLSEFTSPVVFCHNDLLMGNIIFDEETG